MFRKPFIEVRGLTFAEPEGFQPSGDVLWRSEILRNPSTPHQQYDCSTDGWHERSHLLTELDSRAKSDMCPIELRPSDHRRTGYLRCHEGRVVESEEIARRRGLDLSPEQAVGRLGLEGSDSLNHETTDEWIWRYENPIEAGFRLPAVVLPRWYWGSIG